MDLFEDRAARAMEIGRTEAAFDDGDYIFELKLDGDRCLAYVDSAGTDLINRRGNRVLAKLPELKDLHRQVKGRCILDGELVVVRDGKPDFGEIRRRFSTSNPARAAVLQAAAPVTFVAFDILYREGRELLALPLMERKAQLAACVVENQRISLSRFVEEQGAALFQNARDHGLEGVVGKRKDSLYRMGRRTKDWVKCKVVQDDEYVICGYINDGGSYVARLVLGQYDANGDMVYKGHTTLALSSPDFGRIERLPKRKTAPIKGVLPPGNGGVQWVKPTLVCTVEFLHLGPEGLMRHPVYKGLRPDKQPLQVLEPGGTADEIKQE